MDNITLLSQEGRVPPQLSRNYDIPLFSSPTVLIFLAEMEQVGEEKFTFFFPGFTIARTTDFF